MSFRGSPHIARATLNVHAISFLLSSQSKRSLMTTRPPAMLCLSHIEARNLSRQPHKPRGTMVQPRNNEEANNH
eukprot:scaffold72645_cov50-Attheya_sp.AAC.3